MPKAPRKKYHPIKITANLPYFYLSFLPPRLIIVSKQIEAYWRSKKEGGIAAYKGEEKKKVRRATVRKLAEYCWQSSRCLTAPRLSLAEISLPKITDDFLNTSWGNS
jgi:hypothetical protein